VKKVEVDELNDGVAAVLSEGDGYLPLRVRRRYAKAKAVFEAGIWAARKVEFLFSIMIGSMAGVRNSYVELRQDNRNMRKELAKMGLEYADCFCGELSPDSHEFRKRDGTIGVTAGNLWHLHGFFRFAEFIEAADLHSVLSPLWGKIHGSEVVNVKVETDFKKAIKYSVKDAVKHYCSEDNVLKRLLMSSGWLPRGYREVDKVLNRWALLHRYDWENEESMPDQGYAPRLEYIPYVWEQKRDYVRRWCQGESIMLDFGDYYVYIDGERIIKSVGKVAVV
jgi:hypothetical protein